MNNHNIWKQDNKHLERAEYIFWGTIIFTILSLIGLTLLILSS